MRLLCELLHTIPPLPADEVLACLEAERIVYTIGGESEDVLVVTASLSSDDVARLACRLSHTSVLDDYLFSCPVQDIAQNARTHPLPAGGSLAVRVKNRSTAVSSDDVINALADVYSQGRSIDLQNPDHEIRALVTDQTVYVGKKLTEIDPSGFEQRKSQNRPFFTGITMHPRLARALVNLSRVRPGELFCDPFCGSGGILLEAGLMGMSLLGGDIESKMTSGCSRTLEHYGVNRFQLFPIDIGKLPKYVPDVDGIATDFPYGRSTTTKGEERNLLYKRAFNAITEMLKPDRYAVCGVADKDLLQLAPSNLVLQEVYDIRAHRSLTRSFAVFQKSKA